MWAELAAGVLNTAMNIGESYLNYNWAQNAAREERAYNTPKNQIRRLVAAGINPYGAIGGIASSNTSNAFPAQSLPSGSLSSGMLKAFDIAQMKQQIENSKKDIELKDQQIQYNKEMQKGVELDNMLKGRTLDAKVEQQTYQVQIQYLKTLKDQGQITQNQYNNELLKLKKEREIWMNSVGADGIPMYQKQFNLNLQQTQANIQKISAEIRNINARTDLTEQQKEYLTTKLLREDIAYNFEAATNTPWASSTGKSAMLNRIITAVAHALKNGQKNGYKNMEDFIFTILDNYLGEVEYEPKPSLGPASSASSSW